MSALAVVAVLKALIEVALLCLIAQGILFLFAGATRDRNPVYRLFELANRPVWKFARFIAPRVIIDQHIGWVSFFVVLLIWLIVTAAKISLYLKAHPA